MLAWGRKWSVLCCTVQYERLIRPKVQLGLHRRVRVVGQQTGEALKVNRTGPVQLSAVEVVDNDQMLTVQTAGIGQHRWVLLVERGKVAVGDHVVLFAQRDQFLIVGEHRIRVAHLCGGIDAGMVYPW